MKEAASLYRKSGAAVNYGNRRFEKIEDTKVSERVRVFGGIERGD